MIFLYKAWEDFCKNLSSNGIHSITASSISEATDTYLVLKHDVETNVPSAFQIAHIEQKYGHCGSYYVQAYLLEDDKNVSLLQKMQQMGHEISYHYDVMDSARGDITLAMEEFETNRLLFEKKGFPVTTVCQHGNPVVERVGYHSNRDFFRNPLVQERYPDISDIMVNYPEKHKTQYQYFSDAGRIFRKIYDPFFNDIIPSDDQNVPYEDLNALQKAVQQSSRNIISIHPHRWMASAVKYQLRNIVFQTMKKTAKILMKVPLLKKIMSRYYYLAKKI